MIDTKTKEYRGVSLARVEATMNLVKTAFDATGMSKDKALATKWGLIRKAWIAGCTPPVSHTEIGAYAYSVASFAEAVAASTSKEITPMARQEVASFNAMVSVFYRQAVPAVLPRTMDPTVEEPAPEPVPQNQPLSVEPVKDIPPPEAMGPLTPLGGRATTEPKPSAPAGPDAEPPPPGPDVGAGIGGLNSSQEVR